MQNAYKELQDSLPTFVRKPLGITYHGKFYGQGTEFPWKTLGVSFDNARILFHSDQIYHSDKLTVAQKIGDGLDELTIDQLHALVKTINEKVKAATDGNKSKFDRQKCKFSKVLRKQRGLIRTWRANFGHLEN